MSFEEGQNIQKNGGAHGGPHEPAQGMTVIEYIKQELVDNSFSDEGKVLEEIPNILNEQDGDNQNDMSKSTHVFQDFMCDSETPDDIEGYNSVVNGETEWITATVDGYGKISFNSADFSFETDDLNTDNEESNSSVGRSEAPLVSLLDGIVTSKPSFTQAVSLIKNNKNEIQSSPCSPSSLFEGKDKLEIVSGGRQRSYSDSGEILSAQDKAFLEELERGSQLTAEDQELIEDSKKRLQLELQEFVKDGVNSTSKDSLLKSKAALEYQRLSRESSLDGDSVSEAITGNENIILSNVTANTDIEQLKSSLGQNKEVNSNVATVSVSANKVANMTQIIVNTTKKGDQVYQLNTADLQAAAQSLKASGNGSVQNGFIVVSVEGEGPLYSKNLKILDKKYVCSEPGCGAVYNRKSRLQQHIMKQHTGDRPFKCDYPGCSWGFVSAYYLRRHQKAHLKQKNYPCAACGKMYTTFSNLKTHYALHLRPLDFHCPVEACGEGFPTQRRLDQHLSAQHGSEAKLYECPHEGCTKKFFSKACMGSHIQVHERESYVCEYCNKEFTQLSRLRHHVMQHTGEKPYVCHFEGCSGKFATTSKLHRHIKIHTNDRKYQCTYPDCGKKYLRPEHLKGHMISHTGEKPYACPVPDCGARFRSKSSRFVHSKKHESKKHACWMEGCSTVFNDETELAQHVKEKHNVEVGQSLLKPMNLLKSQMIVQQAVEAATARSQAAHNFNNAGVAPGVSLLQPSPEGGMSLLNNGVYVNNGLLQLQQQQQQMQQQTLEPQVDTSPAVNIVDFAQSLLNPITKSSDVNTSETMDMDCTTTSVDLDTPVETKNGSARTDYYSNLVLSNRAKRRRQILRQKIALGPLDLLNPADLLSETKMLSGGGEDLETTATVNPNDVITSQAITFRDPETGTIYVQTQLLQDDPPILEFPEDVAMPTTSVGGQSLLPADLSNILQDVPASAMSEFAASTINLQDLAMS